LRPENFSGIVMLNHSFAVERQPHGGDRGMWKLRKLK
jgi:hypothetical protein